MRKQRISAAIAIAAVLLAYGAMQLVGITCPIKFFTGISCAGCGITRAWLSALRGDLSAAIQFHPLFWLPVPAAVLYCLRKRLPEKVWPASLWVIIALGLGVYLLRMLDPADNIVVFHPEEGLVPRALSWLFRHLGG